MAKFNSKSKSITSKVLNKESKIAFEHSSYQELCDRVLTCFFGEERFYESGKESSDRLKSLVKVVSEKDPIFVAKLAVLAREHFFLRSVSQVLVSELAKYHKGDSLVQSITERVCQRVDDMTEIVSYILSSSTEIKDLNGRTTHKDKKIPNQIKKGIARAFKKFNEYQFQKYTSDKKSVKLLDVMRLVHPKPDSEDQASLWNKIKTGEFAKFESVQKILSAKEDSKGKLEEYIKSKKIPYMESVKNIRNYIKSGISEECHKLLQSYISNEKAVMNSKMYPFRFFQAYKEVSQMLSENPFVVKGYLEALDKAIRHSAKNIEKLQGNTLIVTDISGSMTGTLSSNSSIRYNEVGALLGLVAEGFCENSLVVAFGTNFTFVDVDYSKNIFESVNKIVNLPMGGSTEPDKVIKHILEKNIKVDNILIFTDCQFNGMGNYQRLVKEYRSKVNSEVVIYEINLAGYGSTQINPLDPKNIFMSGWSDNLLKFITEKEKYTKGILDMVTSVEL